MCLPINPAQVMRRLGIKQWPYRKRTSAKKITHSLEVGAMCYAVLCCANVA